MRFKNIALLITVLTMGAATAQAATTTFGLGAGIASPTGDAADVVKLGWNVNVYGDYWLKPTTAIGVDIDGSFFGGDSDAEDGLTSPSFPDPSISLSSIGFNLHGKLAFPREGSKMKPWITAGLGMYNGQFKIEDGPPIANVDESNTEFGFHLGGGLDFAKFGIDARYHSVQTEGDATNYFTVGAHMTFSTNGE